MRIHFDTASMDDYAKFLRVQSIPRCEWRGTMAVIPDEYAAMLGGVAEQSVSGKYKPSKFLFDYQRDISALAITKRKFAVFADCGLGKTLILLEFAKHAAANIGRKNVLIISPLMVVRQTMAEIGNESVRVTVQHHTFEAPSLIEAYAKALEWMK